MIRHAYFAGGCFWCIEPVFEATPGVMGAVSGYSGGEEAEPRYEEVKAQRTGHRETVCVEYEDTLVSFGELMDIYLSGVDPFDDGGQFMDRGRSYTLAVYHTSEEERASALKKLEALERESGRKPCVSVEPFRSFWRAEEYHQDYYRKNPEAFRRELEESGRPARTTE